MRKWKMKREKWRIYRMKHRATILVKCLHIRFAFFVTSHFANMVHVFDDFLPLLRVFNIFRNCVWLQFVSHNQFFKVNVLVFEQELAGVVQCLWQIANSVCPSDGRIRFFFVKIVQVGLLTWSARPVGLGWPLGAPPEVIAGIFFLNLKSRFFFFGFSRDHFRFCGEDYMCLRL